MQRILKPLLLVLLCLMLVHTLVYLAFGVALIPFPFDYDQAEGFELNNAVLLASGRCPYCNNNVYPFYGSGYPPLFHVLMVPFRESIWPTVLVRPPDDFWRNARHRYRHRVGRV